MNSNDQEFLAQMPQTVAGAVVAYAKYLQEAAAAELGEGDWDTLQGRVRVFNLELANLVRIYQGLDDHNGSPLFEALVALQASVALIGCAQHVSDLNNLPLVTPEEIQGLFIKLSSLGS